MTVNTTSNRWPLTLLYDAQCAVCSLEMDHLRQRCGDAGHLVFVDITAAGFDAARWDTTQAELMAQIHAVRPDGSHLIGLAALREAYAVAGLGAWLAPTGWRGVRWLSDRAYAAFARHRQRISRAAAAAHRCAAHPACGTPAAPHGGLPGWGLPARATANKEQTMKVLVCGATGAVGRAVVQALHSRGHEVVAASRGGPAWRVDFMAAWLSCA